eukprot:2708721-Rhodomonas_salina.1
MAGEIPNDGDHYDPQGNETGRTLTGPIADPGKGASDLCKGPGPGQPIHGDGRPAVCSNKRLPIRGKQG